MHDQLPFIEMHLGLYDLVNFWKIVDNVLEMVQDRDMLIMED